VTSSADQLVSYSVLTGILSARLNRPGHEANHSPPSSPEVKNKQSCTPYRSTCCRSAESDSVRFVHSMPFPEHNHDQLMSNSVLHGQNNGLKQQSSFFFSLLPPGVRVSSFTRFLGHTRQTAFDRTPLDE
jgi:hypothetical protein